MLYQELRRSRASIKKKIAYSNVYNQTMNGEPHMLKHVKIEYKTSMIEWLN